MKLIIKEQTIENNGYKLEVIRDVLNLFGIESETEVSSLNLNENVDKKLTVSDIKDEFPARFISTLEYMYNGILSIDALPIYFLVQEITPQELLRYRNFGKDTLEKTREVFKKYGFSW